MMDETGIGERERTVLRQARWDMLRSDIYIRDNGMCWVCNEKVELRDFDLGHLIDRCNGGADAYDNLAVMHKHCNITKPRHYTLEEAMKWKLTAQYLTIRPMSKREIPKEQLSFIESATTPANSRSIQPQKPIPYSTTLMSMSIITQPKPNDGRIHKKQLLHLPKHDEQSVKDLVIEYFKNRPELLTDGLNHER